MPIIGLDFETYGACDLPTHGLDRYVNDPTFRVLLAARAEAECLSTLCDFVLGDYDTELRQLHSWITRPNVKIAAHNAGFEQAVLQRLGLPSGSDMFIDSAAVSRAAGGESKLALAAPQLLGADKMEEGRDLIKLFSIPGKMQEANGSPEFDPDIVKLNPEKWNTFGEYCLVDAELGLKIVEIYGYLITPREQGFMQATADMNRVGWHVDLDMVHEMKRRYEANTAELLAEFRMTHDPGEHLNFNSYPQQKEWCAARGVRANSFDEKNVEKMIRAIDKRIDKGGIGLYKLQNLMAVRTMLLTKQALGGSSLKKLQTIINRTGEDGRLRNEYVHIGAGQTWRTSGNGVQMQNLKRLHGEANMNDLEDEDIQWDNSTLATNIRQVFTAAHPDGCLIVGDLSSIESRGLAWLANATDKIRAFRHGLDVYKVLAAKMYDTPYDRVDKDQRQFGKVGELSCGYQAAGPAVKAFASKMGVELSEADASNLVTDWRGANLDVVSLWALLDAGLRRALEVGFSSTSVAGGRAVVMFKTTPTPDTLQKQHPGAQSIKMVLTIGGDMFLTRIFHGCYMRGRNVGFYKPAGTKTGDLWKNYYRDPKTKEIRFFQLYGGKLAGILTQSMCREMFFDILRSVSDRLLDVPNLELVGQFHDELVLEWTPPKSGGMSLEQSTHLLENEMVKCKLPDFPMAAEIKSDYRYTK